MSRMGVLTLLAVTACGLQGQPGGEGRLKVGFTDPSRPGTVKCHVLNGVIEVTAYEGKEVVIETGGARRRDSPPPRRSAEREPPDPPLVFSSSRVSVEEQNNVITVSRGAMDHGGNLRIQVPVSTSLDLRTVNGRLMVEGIAGEIQAQALNGNIELVNVLGPVVAHSVNGRLKASFGGVPADKPMSFSSLNGSIDVTFPPNLKANLLVESGRGDVYSDFDITLKGGPKTVVEDKRPDGGKYKARVDPAFTGLINGGGSELRFKTFNGKIYLRKK